MESKIIVNLKAFIPWFKQFPFEATEEWGDALRDNIPKTKKAIRKGVPDDKAFFEKIGKPTLDNLDKMLRPGFVNQKGVTKEVILAIARAKLKGKNAAKKYNQSVKKGFIIFDQGELNSAMVGYHRGQCFGEYRFAKAIELALGCLLPIILPAKEGRFKSKLGRQLMSSGKLISNLAFDPAYFKPENDKINRLLNEDCQDDLVPFQTAERSGVPTNVGSGDLPVPSETGRQTGSHCDFVLIKDNLTPTNSKEVQAIKYEIYKHFYGEAHILRRRSRKGFSIAFSFIGVYLSGKKGQGQTS